MIGDGMGIAQITLARLSLTPSSPPLNMDTMPYVALVKTHSANSMVTDSAAAGTALATGFKTNNGMISVLPDGTPVETILERAMKLGKAAGLVTTTTITHATPASFGAHVNSRGEESDIAVQYIEKKIDVLLGGGKAMFTPTSKHRRDLIREAKDLGYAVVESRDALLSTTNSKILGLFQDGALTTDPPEPSLAEMTEKAIQVLSTNRDGFFLMVEGGQIDWRCHDNDKVGTVKQVLQFDLAVGKALEYARKHGDTLVIVTADHETGGLAITGSDSVAWCSKGHTGVPVPLFAYGPGANFFSGVLDNTDVPKKIASLWKVRKFAVPDGK
jgi:alkaline phosphatase